MKAKQGQTKASKGALSKTQEVLYGRDFKQADKIFKRSRKS
ncbi:YfhE-like protein [Thalassobacillus cyri]|uniref:YfhE-like protein n=1 Tax=Thalassobacillus cyri TaxID=571932 RepID=A0A1H4H453_9BACI|nr:MULTISPECIES: YfhE family protein [Thalassobacillus]SEB16564.1 YfhE-like protein [Thalassobacillus cyri]